MKIDRIHHVAYRCRDARETVLWYNEMLKMDFVLAIAEDQVPSTKEPDPYMQVFLDASPSMERIMPTDGHACCCCWLSSPRRETTSQAGASDEEFR